MIKLERMKLAGHVACMGRGEERCTQDLGGEACGKETTWETLT